MERGRGVDSIKLGSIVCALHVSGRTLNLQNKKPCEVQAIENQVRSARCPNWETAHPCAKGTRGELTGLSW